MKKSFLLFVAAIASSVGAAAEITVPSTYDEASGKWIGDIHALTNALHQSKSTENTIYLSKGEYDVTSLTNAYMHTDKWNGGKAILYIGKANVKGVTGDPNDVVIKVDPAAGSRIMIISGSGQLHGVSMTGGNASANCNPDLSNYRVGGAVGFSGNGIVSNCVFYGNRSDRSGGAIGSQHGSKYGKVYNCVFYGNNSSSYGALVACRTTLFNCVITNNVSPGLPRDGDEGYVTESCVIHDTDFADNVAALCGGAYGGCAVNCTFVNNRQNNPLANPWNNAGGGAALDAALTNCTFYGNVSVRLGGAVRGGNLYGCDIISNRTMHATDAYGGGVYGASLVENCNIVSNYCAVYGGGAGSCTRIVNSVLSHNYGGNGGGVYGGSSHIVTNSVITKNASKMKDSELGAGGGGVYGAVAVDCVISDNSSSSYNATLKKCDISGSRVHAKEIDSCVIHDVYNESFNTAEGNVSYPQGLARTNLYMLVVSGSMRNCLVTNCNWRSITGDCVNSAFFSPVLDGATAARVENCTFADNVCYILARNFYNIPDSDPKKNIMHTNSIAFVNCVFAGNRQSPRASENRDIELFSCRRLVFSNCVYGVKGGLSAREAGFVDSEFIGLGASGSPKFVTWEEAPRYTPKLTSPLRGWGLLLDWMTEDATDLAGNPRVREGKVDIGCYQCWLEPKYTSVLVR